MVKILLIRVAKIILSALVEYVLQQHASPNRSRNDMDHPTNQNNPNNPAYTAAQNNRANQLNPNNPTYHRSRSNNQQ